MAFKAGRGVTQGGALSAKLFNILVDAVVREWIWELREGGEFEDGGPSHPPLRQQIVGPLKNRHGAAQGVPHPDQIGYGFIQGRRMC
jgi:hypothetical protein